MKTTQKSSENGNNRSESMSKATIVKLGLYNVKTYILNFKTI